MESDSQTPRESAKVMLFDFCPLEKKGTYSDSGGYCSECEGSICSDAYEKYLSSIENIILEFPE